MINEIISSFKGKIISSLEKVLPETEPTMQESSASMLLNETYNFQLAYYFDGKYNALIRNKLEVEGELKPYITIRQEGLVPVTSIPFLNDDYYLSLKTGVFPDPLFPLNTVVLTFPQGQWRALWVSVKLPENFKAGTYKTTFTLTGENGELLSTLEHELEIIDAIAPETDLVLTNWMHYDCISQKHNCKLWSAKFYKAFSHYLKAYVDCGFNMLLTPLFTPPLDTEIGGERRTAQLVKVIKTDNKYSFDFSELKKFVRFAIKHGIKYFEFSHLFTQWGGTACPKIIAETSAGEKQIFGWETSSDCEEYMRFLQEFLPELNEVVDELGIREKCYFHLTDEPSLKCIDRYEICHNMVKKYLKNIPIMDALSEREFKSRNLVDAPVCYTGSYDSFEDYDKKNLFVYYCCTPSNKYYSNRFINMPSQRTRIFGMQLYKSGVKGFLHWGFNFYNSLLSIKEVNPYMTSDGGGLFPCGDPFIVYPSKDGVYTSIRYESIKEGFADYNALKLLESFIGREKVVDMLDENGIKGYNEYPRSAAWHADFRKKINQLIKENTK